jgi:hypothetical protein
MPISQLIDLRMQLTIHTREIVRRTNLKLAENTGDTTLHRGIHKLEQGISIRFLGK